MLGKGRTCDITQKYPRGIYYFKEQGYDSQMSLQCSDFSRAVMTRGAGGRENGGGTGEKVGRREEERREKRRREMGEKGREKGERHP